jgi:Flp pilus assembly protein TadG
MSVLTSILSFLRSRSRRDDGDRGSVTAVVALMLVPIVGVLAVASDGGRVYVERQRVQTAAESAAMAAASDWLNTGTACSAKALALVYSNADSSSTKTCTTTGSRYSGVVTVSTSEDVPATFAKIVGRSSTTVHSTAAVRVESAGSMQGLRPMALCQQSSALATWQASGFSTSQTFTIGFTGDCEGQPGSWGTLNFTGASNVNCKENWDGDDECEHENGWNSTTDLRSWVANGWSGTVSVGQTISGTPAAPSAPVNFGSTLGLSIAVPVYDSVSVEGATMKYHISSFVGMQIVSTQLTGPASTRNIMVRFVPITTGVRSASSTAPNYGAVSCKTCQLDGQGVCT